ncbi:helix-turn-helix domain-containing protein [Homoserinibacter sp. YIM 151385]|uniref:helix-turn-helix domain-containing protein n=1 Tax=Homoserinibacter sp. YIM 151385 TaxID=2985506 RepID=UPI0022F09BCB|nr:helix-turn-helix domain-containing protein [Homoserinibacter sp. YIM 151385]WBU37565.1 helix-turn-helix domain-containing protein [Homoserinibacter sp. YIM 151385]
MAPAEEAEEGRIHCRLDELLESRGMTLTRLSELVGVSIVNLSVLKNDRARAIRFSTLTAICEALACTPGELLVLAD